MTLKSHISLWEVVAKYLDIHPKSLETAAKRYSQGEVFFTKHLPSLGKDLERGLTGKFELSMDTPFSSRGSSALPAFLNEFFIRIFFPCGHIRPDPVGIPQLRFLCKMFYKFEMPFDQAQLEEASSKFLQVDSAVKTELYPYGLSQVRKHFVSLFPDDPRDIRPHHASGATSLRYSNIEKRHVRHHIKRLHAYYGPEFFFNGISHINNWCAVNPTAISPGHPRVTFVPKDSRGPRTICIFHHMDMQIQKGLQVKLYDYTEKGDSPARGFINFSRQDINQFLAYKGSIDGSLATIDLKDASDMVPWDLIRLICPSEWYEALASTRSDVVTLQGREYTIKKYAAMGSALCFPIEAFLFWSIAKTVSPFAYVYGDDIVVPTESAQDVITALEEYGLLVNRDKTLTTGFFRESCGGDYYKGQNINYPSCRSYAPDKFIAFCNEITKLFDNGLASTCIRWYEESYNEIVYREPLVYLSNPEPYIFYTDSTIASSVFFRTRWNEGLQRMEVFRKHIVSRPEKRKHRSGKKGHLSKDFIPIDDDLLFDWFTTVQNSVAPQEEADYAELVSGVIHECIHTDAFSEGHQVLRRDSKPVTKFEWGLFKKE